MPGKVFDFMKRKKSGIWIVVVLFAAPFVIYLVPQLLGLNAFVVESDSMTPTLSEGDILHVESVSKKDVERGSVIVFEPSNTWSSKNFISHRIIDVKMVNQSRIYKTKGDNNMDADLGWVTKDDIIGERVYSIPFLGYIV